MSKSVTFKIISFNLGGFYSNRGENFAWDKRSSTVLNIIKKHAPDIIGFQEVQPGNFACLNENLSNLHYYRGEKTCSRSDDRETAYNPVFWRAQKFESLMAGGFFISQTPEIWSKNWDSVNVRAVSWVKLKCLENGREFFHFNTHLDHQGGNARFEGSKKIVEMISTIRDGEKSPVILTGDFNARAWAPKNEDPLQYPPPVNPSVLPPSATVYNVYAEHGYKDTFLEAGNENSLATNTYHDCFGENFPPAALRIDWILYLCDKKELATLNFSIIRDTGRPVFASDHFPVMAELKFEN